MTVYVLKFYKGRELIAEQAFDASEYAADPNTGLPLQIGHDCASIVEEAVSCNPPEESK